MKRAQEMYLSEGLGIFFLTESTSFNRDVVHITNQNARLLIVFRLLIIMKKHSKYGKSLAGIH